MMEHEALIILRQGVAVWNRWRQTQGEQRLDLRGAVLRGLSLRDAHLRAEDLRGAVLCGVDLRLADLSYALLREADLTAAHLGETVLSALDLRVVKGLECISHHGPSYIDLHTVYQSKGCIPETFLRGAGVAEHVLTYQQSLTRTPFHALVALCALPAKLRLLKRSSHQYTNPRKA
jgi:hypothetical protein